MSQGHRAQTESVARQSGSRAMLAPPGPHSLSGRGWPEGDQSDSDSLTALMCTASTATLSHIQTSSLLPDLLWSLESLLVKFRKLLRGSIFQPISAAPIGSPKEATHPQ